ncbi:MAG: c-type cytochrome, partial [Gammaproteobacteria bacterium]
PVKLWLRSKDVLHNFTVPQFRVKMDLVPGMVPYMWFTPTRTGKFDILCEELCGVAHYAMRGKFVVEEQSEFDAWLAAQPTYAQLSAQPTGDAEAGKASYAVCIACHGAQGEGNQALNAPKLTGQSAWYMKTQLQNFKQGIRGTDDKDVFGRQMAAMAATLVDDAAINNVVAYIESLPDNPAPVTIEGDAAKGKKIYNTCARCHGLDGQGIWSTNAPRQAGMSDWYLVTQLSNFKHGIRGSHPQDKYGPQMALMSEFLQDDEAINNLVAYINTLGR